MNRYIRFLFLRGYLLICVIINSGPLFSQKVFTFEDIINNPLYNETPDFSKLPPVTLSFNTDSAILPYLFYGNKIPNQIDTPVSTLDGLSQRLNKFDISTTDFFSSFTDMTLIKDTLLDSIFRIDFQLNGKTYESYSYFVPGQVSSDSVAFLIIPGSGYNQSTQIYNNNLSDYHGNICARVAKYGDTYIFTKPMYDFLGIHWNGLLLTHDAFTAQMINNGYSWAAYYLTQSVALAKHLKNKYKKLVILGLSQGGQATTFVSLQVEPTAAIVASGYTVLIEKAAWMGINQIIGHDFFKNYSSTNIFNIIQSQSTKYLFTYGTLDAAYYKSEAENFYTCDFFSALQNVSCVAGNWAHQFGDPQTTEPFIENIIRPHPSLNITSDTAISCSGSTIILCTSYSPGFLFQWYKDSLLLSGENNDSLIINTSGNYQVKVSTSSNVSAFSPMITTLFFEDTTQATFVTQSSNPPCIGDTIILKKDYPSSYKSLQWFLNDSLLAINNNIDSLIVTQSGIYSIQVLTDSGCQIHSQKDTIQFLNIEFPVLLEPSDSAPFCNGDSVSLVYLNLNGYSTFWYFNDSLLSQNNNMDSLIVTQNGLYSLVVLSDSGCQKESQKDTIQFINIGTPVLTTSSDTSSICEGDSVFLVYSNTGNFSTDWFFGDSLLLSNSNSDSLKIETDGTYFVLISDTNGCQKQSDNFYFDIKDTIKPLISVSGDSLQTTLAGTAYQWYLDGNPITGANQYSINVEFSGNYFAEVVSLSGCIGYSDTVFAFHNIYPFNTYPDTSFIVGNNYFEQVISGLDGDTIYGDTVYLQVLEKPLWVNESFLSNSSLILSGTPADSDSGDYTVIIQSCDLSNACTTDSFFLFVRFPVLNILPDSFSFCMDDSLLLSTPDEQGFFFQWYSDSVPIPGETQNSLMVKDPGTYSVRMSASTMFAFSSSITVMKDTAAASFTNQSTMPLCDGDTAIIKIDFPLTYSSLQWFMNDSLLVSNNNIDSLVVTFGGIFSILVQTDSNCTRHSSKDTIQFINIGTPVLTPSSDTSSICEGDSVFLVYSNPGNFFTDWFFGDSLLLSNSNSDSLKIETDGTYFVLISDTNGCQKQSDNFYFDIKDTIKPLISVNEDTLEIDPGGMFYQWYLGEASIYGANQSTYVADTTGTYFVEMVLSNGCIVFSDTINIIISPSFIEFNNQKENPQYFFLLNKMLDIRLSNPMEGEFEVKIFNSQGAIVKQNVFKKNSNDFSTTINLNNISPGMYIVSLQKDGIQINKKIILSY